MRSIPKVWCVIGLMAAMAAGCNRTAPSTGPASGSDATPATTGATTGAAEQAAPTFSLAWSEYPSWSVFGVAHEMGLVDGTAGQQGSLEKEHGIDLVLQEATYDSCLNLFASSNCDAVCITNMDALIVSQNRAGVAVLPTSTSNGADACIVVGINNLDELKPIEVFGLKGTVSEYCFVRCIEQAAKTAGQAYNPKEFKFTNQDPGAAAVAMAQKQDSHKAIMVWNPFVLQTLNDRPDAKVLFDSSSIPGEIVDMVVVGREVLERPQADAFVKTVLATFYRMNAELAKPDTGDQTLVALGEKFSKLGLEDMRLVVQQTQFYQTPQDALALLSSEAFRQAMGTVNQFCRDYMGLSDLQYAFDADSGAALRFDARYLTEHAGGSGP